MERARANNVKPLQRGMEAATEQPAQHSGMHAAKYPQIRSATPPAYPL